MNFRLLLSLHSAIAFPVDVSSADLGAAESIPNKHATVFNETKLEAYFARWHNKCNVKILENRIIVDGNMGIEANQIKRIWRNQLIGPVTGMGGGVKDFVYINYLKADGIESTGKFILTNMKAAAEFWNRLNLMKVD